MADVVQGSVATGGAATAATSTAIFEVPTYVTTQGLPAFVQPPPVTALSGYQPGVEWAASAEVKTR